MKTYSIALIALFSIFSGTLSAQTLSAEDELLSAQTAFKELLGKYNSSNSTISSLQSQLSSAEKRLTDAQNETNSLRQQLQQAQSDAQNYQSQMQQAGERLDAAWQAVHGNK